MISAEVDVKVSAVVGGGSAIAVVCVQPKHIRGHLLCVIAPTNKLVQRDLSNTVLHAASSSGAQVAAGAGVVAGGAEGEHSSLLHPQHKMGHVARANTPTNSLVHTAAVQTVPQAGSVSAVHHGSASVAVNTSLVLTGRVVLGTNVGTAKWDPSSVDSA